MDEFKLPNPFVILFCGIGGMMGYVWQHLRGRKLARPYVTMLGELLCAMFFGTMFAEYVIGLMKSPNHWFISALSGFFWRNAQVALRKVFTALVRGALKKGGG